MKTDQQRWNSAYTGRASRTMQEAFNPYADNTLHPMPSRDYSRAWWVCIWLSAVAAVVVITVF